jgi:hypothetical protein
MQPDFGSIGYQNRAGAQSIGFIDRPSIVLRLRARSGSTDDRPSLSVNYNGAPPAEVTTCR